jgi:hypothetical protein
MATNYNFSIVRDGLVMYLDAANSKSYPGSGTTITDLSRNGNNGTLTNGPTFSNTNGGTIVFDGTNDHILMADNNAFDFGTGDFAVEIWVYFNTLSGAPTLFLFRTYYTGNNGFLFYITAAGALSVYTTGTFSEGVASVGINRWQHLVFTRISGTSYLYNNTVLRDSRAFTFNISVNNSVVIGYDTQYNNDPLNGRVGSARIYSGKGLTASQVLQNYNATKKRFGL